MDHLNSQITNVQHGQGHQGAPSSPQGRQDLLGQPQHWHWVSSVLATSTPCQGTPSLVPQREARQHVAAPCKRETAQLLHLELTQSDAQTGAQKRSICPISSKQTPMAPSRALNEAMHFHKGGCPLMNESGGGTNHSWLLSTRKKEMLLGENYSLCSSYLTILQARSHPTINMLAASWRSSQAWARAIRGKTQLWGWG